MGALEDTLRATFADRVATTPAVDDSAGRAINAARRRRRLRVAYASVAALVTLVLAGGALALIGPQTRWGGPDMVAPPSGDVGLPADVLVGNEIRHADGDRTSLEGLPPAERAYRVRSGWLVVTALDGVEDRTLWLVRPGGSIAQLRDARAFAVSPDGREVAWGGAGRVTVATVEGEQLVDAYTTTGTGDLRPAWFAGGGVLLGGPGGDRGTARWAMWFPHRGDYQAKPSETTTAIGVSVDGRTIYGAVNGSTCLSGIDPETMRARRTACGIQITQDHRAWESPDARRLLIGGGGLLFVHDLSTLWTDGQTMALWSVRAGSALWLDGDAIVAGGVGSVTLLRVDHANKQDASVFLGGQDGEKPVVVVPDLVD